MLTLPEIEKADINPPRIIFTLSGNPLSEQVIAEMRALPGGAALPPCSYHVFADADEVRAHLTSGYRPEEALVIFDGSPRGSSRSWSHHSRLRSGDQKSFPLWSAGARWGIGVNRRTSSCARQTRALFLRRFEDQLGKREFPWGQPKKKEPRPTSIQLDLPRIRSLIAGLNGPGGPDLASSIAKQEFRHRLPAGSRISWNRIVQHPIACDITRWQSVDDAFASFEWACKLLLCGVHQRGWPGCETEEVADPAIVQSVREMILSGVHFADPQMQFHYLYPVADCFSVRRPDVHYQDDGCFASENDEMPGGVAELFFVDGIYGTNQKRWQRSLDWLFGAGPVLFVVSVNWSKVYLTEFAWLVARLQELGRSAYLAVSDNLDDLQITSSAVHWKGMRIGTVWRQFPIFETEGALSELVLAAARSVVRMVPEFAHFGNKSWFSIFRQHRDWFGRYLNPRRMALLDQLLPDSHLVRGQQDFPLIVGGQKVGSLDQLCALPVELRNTLVLKVSGANEHAARSRGVFMDKDISEEDWRAWINDKIRSGTPFLVQRLMDTAVVPMPVYLLDGAEGGAELFRSRLLIRPWSFGGRIVSAHAVAAPHTTRKVHGMIDMAVVPCDFGE